MKKVLNIISGDLLGGAEMQVVLQSEALIKNGWDISVLVFNHGKLEQKLAENNIKCFVCLEQKSLISLIYSSLIQVKSQKPQILVSHGYKESFIAGLASFLFRVPWIAVHHGASESYTGFKRIKRLIYSALHLLLSRVFASRIVAVSRSVARDLNLVGSRKLRIVSNVARIANSIDCQGDFFISRPAIIMIGRLAPVKNISLALSAFANFFLDDRFKTASLNIVGDGPLREELENSACALPCASQIHFWGFREDRLCMLKNADLLLITSSSEGMPTVALEAATLGIPLVATAVGGLVELKELLPSYPMTLVSSNDPNELAQAITDALICAKDRVGKDLVGKIKAEFAEHFLPERAAEKLEAVFDEVLCCLPQQAIVGQISQLEAFLNNRTAKGKLRRSVSDETLLEDLAECDSNPELDVLELLENIKEERK